MFMGGGWNVGESRWCNFHEVISDYHSKSGGHRPVGLGNIGLRSMIRLCEAAGWHNMALVDTSSFSGVTRGRLLQMFQRGWTWYMRNGFFPVYHEGGGINPKGTANKVASDLMPHLRRYCTGQCQ